MSVMDTLAYRARIVGLRRRSSRMQSAHTAATISVGAVCNRDRRFPGRCEHIGYGRTCVSGMDRQTPAAFFADAIRSHGSSDS